jgi:hypothetical protein
MGVRSSHRDPIVVRNSRRDPTVVRNSHRKPVVDHGLALFQTCEATEGEATATVALDLIFAADAIKCHVLLQSPIGV